MSMKYKNLLSPIKVRDFILKNRLLAANSLPHFLQGPETYPAEPVITHFANKAKGASIVTCTGIDYSTIGAFIPMESDISRFPAFNLYNPQCQTYFSQLADAIHFYDSLACMGMFVGPMSSYTLMKKEIKKENPGEPVNMSAYERQISPAPKGKYEIEEIPGHMAVGWYDEENINKIVESFAEQAELLQRLGYDMVSVHCAYRASLPGRFMSPLSNRRTDKFGGSLENRMRFLLMIFERMRERVGPNFLIEIQWSAEEPQGGYTIDDSITFLNEAKKYIDIVQIRPISGEESSLTNWVPEPTISLDATAYIKKNVPGLLVSAVNGYFDIDYCESAIAEGKVDFIASARAWISNSNYGELIKEGREDDRIPCLRCNKCHGRADKDPFLSVCSVNPIIGWEHKIDNLVLPTEGGKKVAVIGGGPAGMRCAMYLQDRGHIPTVFEASDSLGGTLKHSDHVPFKWTLKDFKGYLIYQIKKRGIEVKLNTKANPEMIKEFGFDAVVTALGAEPVVPPIPGLEESGFVFATDALTDEAALGKNVVIIGGGEVGVETGIHLARCGHDAKVLEMQKILAADCTKIHYRNNVVAAFEKEEKFHGIINAKVSRISDDRVFYIDAHGIEQSVPYDSIVVAVGMKAKDDQAMSFYGAAEEFYFIGDCKRPASIQYAMRDAFAVASRI